MRDRPRVDACRVLQQVKSNIAIPMHYHESTHVFAMFVKSYPNTYLDTHKSIFSIMALPARAQIVEFTPWQMRDYR